MSTRRRILYIQYANPAAYPPLQHSARLLARDGWSVLVLGVASFGTETLEWPAIDGVEFKLLRGSPRGILLKIQYLAYTAWAIYWTLRWRPSVVYASDPMATPVARALATLFGCHVVYHEHDSPGSSDGASQALVARCRVAIAQRARMCVLPNNERAAAFVAATGAFPTRTRCVWNCPLIEEVRPPEVLPSTNITIYYHGTINEKRLPLAILDAMVSLPPHVRLNFAGYETLGSQGYAKMFVEYGRARGLAERVRNLGGASTRQQVMEWASESDLGLALMPIASDDINMRFMVGASNKAFDYMACGLALVVSNLPEWENAFVKPGYAVACDPGDASSIAAALRVLIDDAPRRMAMGRACVARIRDEWNYERQFRPVLEELNAFAATG